MVLRYDYSNRNRWRRRTNAPPSLAISIAMAVRWCDNARISRWRRSRALIEATKRRHRASTRSDSINRLCCGGLCFCSMLWSKRCAAIKCTQAQPGHRGSPESSPQRENICGTIPRPARSRSGETGWGATNAYIEGANYL